MKKTILALGLVTASSMATAGMMGSDVLMRVNPVAQGAWVQVMQNGAPVEGATITLSGALGEFETAENGIAFVMTEAPNTRTGVFTATLPNGEEIQKSVVIPRNH